MRRPTLHEVIQQAEERATHTNFMNEMHAMERRRNYKLQLGELNDMIYGNLTPGMRDSLTHRRKELKKKVDELLASSYMGERGGGIGQGWDLGMARQGP